MTRPASDERHGAAPNNRRFQRYVPSLVAHLRHGPGATHGRIDATMVYTDLAGFTALSERVAGGGRVATEELTGVLSRSFERMLVAASSLGGDLLKFGGDALVLLFHGEDHPARAAAAAWDMRAELRSASRRERVSLHMAAGIHSGLFDWFMVGDLHHELVITGPVASALIAMEKAAKANDILLSPATAERLNLVPREGHPISSAGLRLGARPDVPGVVSLEPAISDADLEAVIPILLRPHLGTPSADGEHRRVVVAFIQFSGLDPLLAANATRFVAASLNTMISCVERSADRYGVCFLATDIDANGGKIILTAGAPTLSANDEERMLLCLREIFAETLPVELRAGVNVGHVFAGDVGSGNRCTYTVMGDAVNLAARLMAHAGPGQILADPGVIKRCATLFEATEIPPFVAKGKSGTVRALAIGRAIGVHQVARAYNFPLVNRRRELAVFADALESIQAGEGRAIELRGEPGVGKSRLVDELLQRAGNLRTSRFSAQQYSMGVPYSAFRDVVREAVGIRTGGAAGAERLRAEVERAAPYLLPWLPLLAAVADVPSPATPESDALDPKFRKARIAETVIGLLLALLHEPAVLVFEDTYFLDDSSRELLAELVASVASAPWLVCVVSHPGTTPLGATNSRAYTALEIDPLGLADAEELAAEAAGVFPVSALRLHAAIERAGGNPLFLLEMLASSGDATSVDDLPATVELVIAARIDELGPIDRRFLRDASVLGTAFPVSLLEACFRDEPGWSADEGTWSRLSPFIERSEHDVVRFRHRLFRDAAYEGLPFHMRRDLHARLVDVLEQSPAAATAELEVLALHASRAQLHPRAWRYSFMAGDRSRARSANAEAANFYQQALEHVRKFHGTPPEEIARIHEARSDMLELSGQYGEADAALAAAQRLLSPDNLPRVLVKRGTLRERTGEYTRALRILTRARTLAMALPPGPARMELEAECAVSRAAVLFRKGRFREAERKCREAVAGAEECAAWATVAHAYFLLDHSLAFLKSPEAGRYGERALRIYEELGDLVGQGHVLNNLGVKAYEAGQLDDALAFWRRSMEACERAGDSVGAARQRNNIGEVLCDRGQNEEADALFRRALAVFRDAKFALGVAYANSNLGRAATRAGHPKDAAPLLEEALAGFKDLGAPQQVADTELRIVENLQALAAQDHASAIQLIEGMLAGAEAPGRQRAMLLRLKATSLLATGDVVAARRTIAEALECDATLAADPEFAKIAEALALPADP